MLNLIIPWPLMIHIQNIWIQRARMLHLTMAVMLTETWLQSPNSPNILLTGIMFALSIDYCYSTPLQSFTHGSSLITSCRPEIQNNFNKSYSKIIWCYKSFNFQSKIHPSVYLHIKGQWKCVSIIDGLINQDWVKWLPTRQWTTMWTASISTWEYL